MGKNPDRLRVGEVAEILGVSPETVRNWTAKGKLPALLTPGGHRFYRRADVEACLVPIGTPEDAAGAA